MQKRIGKTRVVSDNKSERRISAMVMSSSKLMCYTGATLCSNEPSGYCKGVQDNRSENIAVYPALQQREDGSRTYANDCAPVLRSGICTIAPLDTLLLAESCLFRWVMAFDLSDVWELEKPYVYEEKRGKKKYSSTFVYEYELTEAILWSEKWFCSIIWMYQTLWIVIWVDICMCQIRDN